MKVSDINQLLKSPEGHEFIGASASGAFLQLSYEKKVDNRKSLVYIYLNDSGREVIRVFDDSVDWCPEPGGITSDGNITRNGVGERPEKKNWWKRFLQWIGGILRIKS